MIKFLVPLFAAVIFGLPLTASVGPILAVHPLWAKLLAIFASPMIFSVTFMLVTGLLSKPFHKAIMNGTFPRDLSHPVYGPRRLYGLCWTAMFYNVPVYYLCLTIPTLKKVMLRLFGYPGSTNITVYPDTWIRDLPLLKLADGVYLSNKATIGTNICLSDGNIMVGRIRAGMDTIVGHLAMLAPGATLGDHVEIGVGVGYGIRASVGDRSKVGPTCTVNHGAQIGADCEIGTQSYVGMKVQVADGIRIPAGANIPNGAILSTQEDVDSHIHSETMILARLKESLAAGLRTDQLSQVVSKKKLHEPDKSA